MTSSDFTRHIGQIRDFKQLMIPAGETPWVEQHAPPAHPVDVVLYLGCNILRTAHLAYEAVDVFRALGVSFIAVGGPQFCCGIIHHRAGDVSGASRVFQATAMKVRSYRAKQVVIWCPTCQLRFEETFQEEKASRFPITHVTEFLAEQAERLPFRCDVPARVALHTHVGTAQRELDAKGVARILQAVPGVEVAGTLSSPDLDYHCSPLLFSQFGPERFRSIRDDLVRKAAELGTDALVTPYHSCHREWCEVGRAGLVVRNYISMVAEALGCARRDYFQEFKRLHNAEAIAALSRPVWESHGLSEAQAKALAAKYFVPDPGR